MHAAAAGPDDGPLVILLHGFPEFWYSWRHQIGPLAAAGYHVVTPDLRGYNLSERKPPYDAETLARDVGELIGACGRTRAFIVGHDWGGIVAWQLAIQRPDLVARLAIVNIPHPAAMSNSIRQGNLRQLVRSWYVFFFQLPFIPEWLLSRGNFRLMRRSLEMTSRSGTFTSRDIARYVESWARPGALAGMLGPYRALRRTRQFRRGVDGSARVVVPTVILWGERDVALGPELAEESLKWLDDGRLIRFPDATHWLHMEFPDTVNRHVLDHFGQSDLAPMPMTAPKDRHSRWLI
jgi:epoxide hydrolase 4